MNPFMVEIYIGFSRNSGKRYYDVELFKSKEFLDTCEFPNWESAKKRARSLCRIYGLQVFSVVRHGEHRVGK